MAKRPKEIRIEPLQKNAFLVHHSLDLGNGPYKEPKKYSFQSHADMIAHVAKVTKPPKAKSFKDALGKLYDSNND